METTNTTEWYNKTWLVLVLCLFLFPVGLYALYKNKTIGTIWKIAIVLFIVIAVVAQMGNKGGNTQTSTATESTSETKQWKEVYAFKGNGMKKSATFHLSGGSARLKYKYKSESNDLGLFSAYIVEEGKDIMKDGGIPDVMSQKTQEESETSLHTGSGNYYLHVNAAGNWSVSVEELQ